MNRRRTYALGQLARVLVAGRKAKGWTQAAAAEEAGIAQTRLSRWEVGESHPPRDAIAIVQVICPELTVEEFRRAVLIDVLDALARDENIDTTELEEIAAAVVYERNQRRLEAWSPTSGGVARGCHHLEAGRR